MAVLFFEREKVRERERERAKERLRGREREIDRENVYIIVCYEHFKDRGHKVYISSGNCFEFFKVQQV